MAQAKLLVHEGPRKGEVFPITRPRAIIGRSSSCDVIITGYEELSREHARLVWDGKAFRIEDMGSRNGTIVNGRQVSSGRVSSGDRLQLGDLLLELSVPPGGPDFAARQRDAAVLLPPQVPRARPALPQPRSRPPVTAAVAVGVVALAALAAGFGLASMSATTAPRPAAAERKPVPDEKKAAVVPAAPGELGR
jgi:predicted component of type VI protein secretion system